MSKENLEIVRRWLATFNSWDVAGFVDLWDPECEFFTLTGSHLRHETDELWEVGERIVAIGRLCGRGLGGGAGVKHQLALVFDLRGEHILRVRSYSDRTEALESAKLAV